MSWLRCFKLKWNHLYVFDFAFDGGMFESIPVLINAVGNDCEGHALRLQWKCWVYESDPEIVMWELRRLVYAIFTAASSQLHCLLRRELAPWVQFVVAVFGAAHFVPSTNVLKTAGKDPADYPMARDEYSCSTEAMLLLALFLIDNRRKKSDKTRALGHLASLFSTVFTIAELTAMEVDRPPPHAAGTCGIAVANALCVCCRDAAAKLRGIDGITPWHRHVRRGAVLYAQSDCPMVKAWLCAQLGTWAESLRLQVVENRWHIEAIESNRETWVANGKRRRHDEDKKSAVVELVAAASLARNSEFVDTGFNGSSMQVHRLVNRRVMEWIAAQFLQWHGGGTFAVLPDGCRFSNPAEEMIFYPVWHAETSSASFLTPMVLAGWSTRVCLFLKCFCCNFQQKI